MSWRISNSELSKHLARTPVIVEIHKTRALAHCAALPVQRPKGLRLPNTCRTSEDNCDTAGCPHKYAVYHGVGAENCLVSFSNSADVFRGSNPSVKPRAHSSHEAKPLIHVAIGSPSTAARNARISHHLQVRFSVFR